MASTQHQPGANTMSSSPLRGKGCPAGNLTTEHLAVEASPGLGPGRATPFP